MATAIARYHQNTNGRLLDAKFRQHSRRVAKVPEQGCGSRHQYSSAAANDAQSLLGGIAKVICTSSSVVNAIGEQHEYEDQTCCDETAASKGVGCDERCQWHQGVRQGMGHRCEYLNSLPLSFKIPVMRIATVVELRGCGRVPGWSMGEARHKNRETPSGLNTEIRHCKSIGALLDRTRFAA